MEGTAKKKNKNMVSGSIGRLVKRTGQDTLLTNALRDGAQFAWVPNGDTCAFCLTLASRGWQKMSKKALKNGHAEHIHSNCDCTYAVRFDNRTQIPGYDPDAYKQMYDSAEGRSPTEKVNSIRRIKYQENKDRINAQKRAAYMERKTFDSVTNNDIIISMNRARNINTIDDLRRVSSSKVIDMTSYGEIQNHFKAEFDITVSGFPKNSLFEIQSTLSGFDDMLNEFPEIQEQIHTIQYVGNLGVMGEWNSNGLVRIGKKGLKDYGTGVHESSHALDYVRSKPANKYSEMVVEEARANLKLRKNSKEYRNYCVRITGDINDSLKPEELFAYAIETAKGGVDNKLATEMYKITKGEKSI